MSLQTISLAVSAIDDVCHPNDAQQRFDAIVLDADTNDGVRGLDNTILHRWHLGIALCLQVENRLPNLVTSQAS